MSAALCGKTFYKLSFHLNGRSVLFKLELWKSAEVVAKGKVATQVGKEAESRICNVEANATSSVDVYWTKKMQIHTERHSRKLVRFHWPLSSFHKESKSNNNDSRSLSVYVGLALKRGSRQFKSASAGMMSDFAKCCQKPPHYRVTFEAEKQRRTYGDNKRLINYVIKVEMMNLLIANTKHNVTNIGE
ncbi:hypothetical protein Tco_0844095 [Tanacetum coccineum]